MLDTLLTTLIREMLNENIEGRKAEAKSVARRFVRSVARIFVVLNIEMTPQSGKKKRLVILKLGIRLSVGCPVPGISYR